MFSQCELFHAFPQFGIRNSRYNMTVCFKYAPSSTQSSGGSRICVMAGKPDYFLSQFFSKSG